MLCECCSAIMEGMRCVVIMIGGWGCVVVMRGDGTGYVTGALFCEGPTPVTTSVSMILFYFLLFFF